ncbi:AIM36 [[Candida] subhashii]|uniref:AIM36 n=1 Tax=[Candida] subhashii TaxID=561895 RepID=A0A8J5QRH2_9ASCO|nr:AIM36 [[Candida] subhashii]KAG7665336.1 AIM36 [[Candida] subhashii]
MFSSRLFSSRLSISRGLAIPRIGTTTSVFSPTKIISRNYAVYLPIKRKRQARLRYIFYMVLVSFGAMYYVSHSVDKRNVKKSFSEGEFKQYEQETGLRRRHKLISHDLNEKYQFYVVPYVHDNQAIDKIVKRVEELGRKVRVIDPAELIKTEKEDERNKYCYLLQDLDDGHKEYPAGLITALIKQYISFFMNTRDGTFDTTFIIKNYPQHTAEAIKFENDVCDINQCIVLNDDIENQLPQEKDDETVRAIKNVDGYFGSVGKTKTLVNKSNKLESELKKVISEDF